MAKNKNPIKAFKTWWEQNGDEVFDGYLRFMAAGGCNETFREFVLGEYENYRENPAEYEVPYHGILDQPCEMELRLKQLVKV